VDADEFVETGASAAASGVKAGAGGDTAAVEIDGWAIAAVFGSCTAREGCMLEPRVDSAGAVTARSGASRTFGSSRLEATGRAGAENVEAIERNGLDDRSTGSRPASMICRLPTASAIGTSARLAHTAIARQVRLLPTR
jgi:hypothetical protein